MIETYKRFFILDDDIIMNVNDINEMFQISKQYNKNGVFFELNCTIPFGFFNKYLVLRLQFQDMVWYFSKITSLNYYRLKELLIIAETFNAKK